MKQRHKDSEVQVLKVPHEFLLFKALCKFGYCVTENFAIDKYGSVRYKDSAVPYMKRLLNKYQFDKEKLLKVIHLLSNYT